MTVLRALKVSLLVIVGTLLGATTFFFRAAFATGWALDPNPDPPDAPNYGVGMKCSWLAVLPRLLGLGSGRSLASGLAREIGTGVCHIQNETLPYRPPLLWIAWGAKRPDESRRFGVYRPSNNELSRLASMLRLVRARPPELSWPFTSFTARTDSTSSSIGSARTPGRGRISTSPPASSPTA